MCSKRNTSNDALVESIRTEIAETSPTPWHRAFEKFISAAVGSIPWVGGFIAAAIDLKLGERETLQDDLQTRWLNEHTDKLGRLADTLNDITARFDDLGEQIHERIQSEDYLNLVRRAFRAWDRADTDEKRRYVANLVSNASGTTLCSDDVIRLFIDWLDTYHEAHFAVIREIYQNPGCTRHDIWSSIYREFPREDSAEADLFKLLVRDLSTGSVIRQRRTTTEDGQFLKKRTTRRRSSSRTMESAFEDTKPYVLTELGKQFIHYTMSEAVPRIGAESNQQTEGPA